MNSDIKAKILHAAQKRLWLYGYKKTTIEEIASDAGIGKGTVYLHFAGKEEIALEIVAQFKRETLAQSRSIALDSQLTLMERITDILRLPILAAHERYSRSPETLEMVTAIRPAIKDYVKPLIAEEIALLASLLADGNAQGLFAIEDVTQAAQTLKYMCHGFLPPYPCLAEPEDIGNAIGEIVTLAYQGFRAAKSGCRAYE